MQGKLNRRVIISILSTGFVLLILALVIYNIRFRQSTAPIHAESVQIKFTNDVTSVKKGDEFVVDIYIDTKGKSVTASDLRVKYNPLLLQVQSITPGNFLPVVLLPQQLTSGFARIVLGSDVTNPKNGTGILESVKFKVLGQGTTANLSFEPSSAVSAIGQDVSAIGTLPSLDIKIEGDASAAPTGDVNGDGVVNIIDTGIIIDNYGKPIPDPKADLNLDGSVNIIDIGISNDNYGK